MFSHNKWPIRPQIYIYIYIYIYAAVNRFPLKWRTRLIASETIANCQTVLKKETCGCVYIGTDPNHMFNSFLCTFVNTFHAGVPVKYETVIDKNNWITQGIKIYCKYTRSLCAVIKNSSGPKVKQLYINYCEIL
jgi:hypothetical protein